MYEKISAWMEKTNETKTVSNLFPCFLTVIQFILCVECNRKKKGMIAWVRSNDFPGGFNFFFFRFLRGAEKMGNQ